MMCRSQLVQIIAFNVGLLIASFAPVSGLPVALAEVRLPLAMVLGVAIFYLWLSQPELLQAIRVRRTIKVRRGSLK